MTPPAGSPEREHRVAFAAVFDDEARPHDEALHTVAAVQSSARVLDIGCGTGQSTRIAARAAYEGSALGVDISPALIEHARRLSAVEGPDNVAFEHADAGTCPFPDEQFDVCISRFGSMFFTDPYGAFTNIARAVRSGGRLALLVWQAQAANEWSVAVDEALLLTAPGDPQPFSFADPGQVRDVLGSAGFVDVEFVDVHAPVRYGADAATAYEFVLGFSEPKRALAEMDAGQAEVARARVRDLVAAHETPDGVFFDSRAWVISARRGR